MINKSIFLLNYTNDISKLNNLINNFNISINVYIDISEDNLLNYARNFSNKKLRFFPASHIIKNNLKEIIALSSEIGDLDYFFESILYLRNKINYKNRIFHPLTLNKYLKRKPNKNNNFYLVTGYPGSGNMTIQEILNKMLPEELVPRWSLGIDCGLLANFGMQYLYSVRNICHYNLTNFKVKSSPHVTPTSALYCSMSIDHGEYQSWISNLKTFPYLWTNIFHNTHELLNLKSYKYYIKNNFKILIILRNPLDIIISNANKQTNMGFGKSDPLFLLNNNKWLSDISISLSKYYEEYHKLLNQENILFIKYEELLNFPLETLNLINNFLQLDLNTENLKNIWEVIGYKNLPSAPKKHLWKPGEGKWKIYLNKNNIHHINKKLIDVAEKFDYIYNFEELNDYIYLNQNLYSDQELSNLYITDCKWNSITKKNISLNSYDIIEIEINKIKFYFNKNTYNYYFNLLNNDIFIDIISASN